MSPPGQSPPAGPTPPAPPPAEAARREIRVLVIDDSAYNRQTITSMLESVPGIRVVARAGDGDEGLRQAFLHDPDVVTLDLEMPKMDGFTFLRILMSRRPTPILVISSHSRKENVFKALELGALDFIAKPTRQVSSELRAIEAELIAKVRLVTQLRAVSLAERAKRLPSTPPSPPAELQPADAPLRVVAIGASTGGPPALQQILASIDAALPIAVLVTQHMPASFTSAFAERLDRCSAFEVREARTGDLLRPGLALVAPGDASLVVERSEKAAGRAVVRLEPPGPKARFIPSVDRMLESAAEAFGADVLAVILTGMGGDGARGVRAVKQVGGRCVAEARETAVIFGMPADAISTGLVDEVLPLGDMAIAIDRFARRATSA